MLVLYLIQNTTAFSSAKIADSNQYLISDLSLLIQPFYIERTKPFKQIPLPI